MHEIVRKIVREELEGLNLPGNSINEPQNLVNSSKIKEFKTVEQLVDYLLRVHKASSGETPKAIRINIDGAGKTPLIQNSDLFNDIIKVNQANLEVTGKLNSKTPIMDRAYLSIYIGDSIFNFGITKV